MNISKRNFWVAAAFYGVIGFCMICFCTFATAIVMLGVENRYVWNIFILIILDIILGLLAYRIFQKSNVKIGNLVSAKESRKLADLAESCQEELN